MNCDCLSVNGARFNGAEIDRAMREDYWQTLEAGHHTAASLALDGLDIGDLP